MSLPVFNFKLRPLDQIEPWTQSDGSNPTLSWFGLTDGYYWLRLGEAELFRYQSGIVSKCGMKDVYVDYQIVRLYEDILDMLPEVVEPVPDDIVQSFVLSTKTESSWTEKCRAWVESNRDEENHRCWDICYGATQWWSARSLDSGHLTAAPKLNIWRQGETIYFRWDNRDKKIDGLLAWVAELGEHSMLLAEFLNQLRDFHDRFIEAMARRTEAVCAGWNRTEIKIDLDRLREEQAERALALDEALKREAKTDWNKIRKFNEQILESNSLLNKS